MFTEKNLVFPIPKGYDKDHYLDLVLQNRTARLKLLKGGRISVDNLEETYVYLAKIHSLPYIVEGLAQIIQKTEKLPATKLEEYVKEAPLYFDGQRVNFGTLYLDEKPVRADTCSEYDSKSVSIGNTIDGIELHFIAVTINGKKLFVSDRNLLSMISWAKLDEYGLIDGREVFIDGKEYLLRVLVGRDDVAGSNEWDTMISLTNDDDNLWHWESAYSWCKGNEDNACFYPILRGFFSAATGCKVDAFMCNHRYAWRPVLEEI